MMFPLIGNEGIKSAFEQALSSGRIPHAIIIEGEQSSGKSTLAEYITSACLCEAENKPCGVCKSCHLVKVSTHPDMFYIAPEEKKKNIAVEQIRKMREQVYIRPQMSSRKVFNIDYADTLNPQSQNTLLKVLEEPPGDVVFILQVKSRASLLPTVLSRCVTYTLTEPSLDMAADYIADKCDIPVADAKELLQQNGLQIGNVLSKQSSRKKSGVYDAAVLYMSAVSAGSLYELIEITSSFEKDRVAAGEFLNTLSYLLLCNIKEKAIKSESNKKNIYYYDCVKKAYELSKSNINLPLLFSKLAADFKL
ncbi:MAG: DNA polymerase III subunit [Acutalibacteraceae bacterium]|nr:DNA polymerase III subunit [Acutalibacteraceae bacterium]